MKKSLLTLGLALTMTSAAMADNSNITCIGTLDGVNARVILLGNDDKGEVEIHIDGDDTYSGEYFRLMSDPNKAPSVEGRAKSESKATLSFNITFKYDKDYTKLKGADVKVTRSITSPIIQSTLQCVGLELSTK